MDTENATRHPVPGFVPNAKQRKRLKAIDTSGKAWHPANGGEAQMADVLETHGLLTGPHYPGRVYAITPAGQEAARSADTA